MTKVLVVQPPWMPSTVVDGNDLYAADASGLFLVPQDKVIRLRGAGYAPLNGAVPYIGQVGSTGLIPDQKNAGAQQLMSRSPHWVLDDVTWVQLAFGNFYVFNQAETALGTNSAQITASIENPAGVFTRVTFNAGQITGVIPPNSMIWSDPIPVNIRRLTQIACRTWYNNPDGIAYCAYPNFGNLMNFGATVADLTMTAGTIPAQTGAGYGPLAMISYTSRPSVGMPGDSRWVGLGDTPDSCLVRSWAARMLTPAFATINLGVGGDRCASFVSSHAIRHALLAFTSHIWSNYCINDILSGGTAAAAHASLQQLIALPNVAGKPFYQTTLEPIGVTGTPWNSDGGQTASATNPQRVIWNDTLLGGVNGVNGILDVNKIAESPTKTGVFATDGFAANPITNDGNHLNRRGNLIAQARIPAPLIVR